MMHGTHIFHGLSAANLVTYLVKATNLVKATMNTLPTKHQAFEDTIANWNWHFCWLNDNYQPIIGLLPRASWTVLPKALEQNSLVEYKDSSDNAASDDINYDNVAIELITTRRPFLNDENNSKIETIACTETTLDNWQQMLIDYANTQSNTALNIARNQALCDTTKTADKATYDNGLMGFIGYDIGAKALSPQSNIALANQPSAFLGHYDIYLTPADNNNAWQLHAQADTDPDIVAMVWSWLEALDNDLQSSVSHDARLPTPSLTLSNQWQSAQYKEAFNKTQEYLYAGDSYQINLTQQWHSTFSKATKLITYLPALYQNTKAPFAGYLSVNDSHDYDPANSFELLSCSPELFVTFSSGQNNEINITTKPIKGTRPRGSTPQVDEQLKNELKNSEKDRAENVMIVDLLRNDLGKYAKTGSVQVPKLFAIETFSNVHHMVSTVTATIKDDVHPLTVLFDSLPAGSITGTPKKRAVEIISELEADARGAYCGTMGYMNFDGTGQWNVLIRTLQANIHEGKTSINLWAGGGITVGSESDAEYQECFDKVGNLLKVLQGDK